MKTLAFIFLFVITSCSSSAQDASAELKQAEQQLSSGKSVTEILTNPSYMKLHSLTSFRDLIKRFAKQEKITLVSSTEPGTHVTIKGNIAGKNSKPSGNVLVYVYHTDNKGWYSDTAPHVQVMEGDRGHARIFGYFKTNDDGSFEFHTIHPQGYPKSDLPQHIHFEVFTSNGENLLVTELLFDDDARLAPVIRERFKNEGAVISKNTGSANEQVYTYTVRLK